MQSEPSRDLASLSKTVNLLEISAGMTVKLADGATAQVVENPMDGIWLICRYVSHPARPELVTGDELPLFAQDIVAFSEVSQ